VLAGRREDRDRVAADVPARDLAAAREADRAAARDEPAADPEVRVVADRRAATARTRVVDRRVDAVVVQPREEVRPALRLARDPPVPVVEVLLQRGRLVVEAVLQRLPLTVTEPLIGVFGVGFLVLERGARRVTVGLVLLLRDRRGRVGRLPGRVRGGLERLLLVVELELVVLLLQVEDLLRRVLRVGELTGQSGPVPGRDVDQRPAAGARLLGLQVGDLLQDLLLAVELVVRLPLRLELRERTLLRRLRGRVEGGEATLRLGVERVELALQLGAQLLQVRGRRVVEGLQLRTGDVLLEVTQHPVDVVLPGALPQLRGRRRGRGGRLRLLRDLALEHLAPVLNPDPGRREILRRHPRVQGGPELLEVVDRVALDVVEDGRQPLQILGDGVPQRRDRADAGAAARAARLEALEVAERAGQEILERDPLLRAELRRELRVQPGDLVLERGTLLPDRRPVVRLPRGERGRGRGDVGGRDRLPDLRRQRVRRRRPRCRP
jgi:hypothetical protein